MMPTALKLATLLIEELEGSGPAKRLLSLCRHSSHQFATKQLRLHEITAPLVARPNITDNATGVVVADGVELLCRRAMSATPTPSIQSDKGLNPPSTIGTLKIVVMYVAAKSCFWYWIDQKRLLGPFAAIPPSKQITVTSTDLDHLLYQSFQRQSASVFQNAFSFPILLRCNSSSDCFVVYHSRQSFVFF